MNKRVATIEINDSLPKKIQRREKIPLQISDLYDELLGTIASFCGEYAFVFQFVCKRWHNTFHNMYLPLYLNMKEWKRNPSTTVFSLRSAGYFRVEFAKWAFGWMSKWRSAHARFAEYAALAGNAELVKWLIRDELKWRLSEGVMLNAAEGGSMEILKWLKPMGCEFPHNITSRAAKGGHLDIMKWLTKLKTPWDQSGFEKPCKLHGECFIYAVKRKDFEMLEWLKEKGCPVSPGKERHDGKIFEVAAGTGDVKVMEWLHNNGFAWDDRAPYEAINRGHREAFEWLKTMECPVDNHMIASVFTAKGDLEALKTMEDYLSSELVFHAVGNGHIDVIEWLKETKGYSVDIFGIMSTAALSGSVEMLQWLKDQGVRFSTSDDYLFTQAIAKSNIEMMEWLKREGFKWNALETSREMGRVGNVDVLKWVKDNEFDITRTTLSSAALHGHIDMLKWFYGEFSQTLRCMKTSDVCSAAAINGHFEILQWAFGVRCYPNTYAYYQAAKGPVLRVNVIKWLEEQGIKKEVGECCGCGTLFCVECCYCHVIDNSRLVLDTWREILKCPCSLKIK
jgi:hypothetical protein